MSVADAYGEVVEGASLGGVEAEIEGGGADGADAEGGEATANEAEQAGEIGVRREAGLKQGKRLR